MKKLLIGLISLLLLVGCGNNESVSKEEYDKVVRERDEYKELYEALTGQGNIDNYVMDVDITTENFFDYFDFKIVVEQGTDKDYYCISIVNKKFDEGWVFEDCNGLFTIKYIGIDGNEYTTNGLFERSGLLDGFYYQTDLYSDPKVQLISVSGIVRFAKLEACNYKWDIFDMYRTVIFPDEKKKTTQISPAIINNKY